MWASNNTFYSAKWQIIIRGAFPNVCGPERSTKVLACPPQTKPNAPSHMYYEIQSKNCQGNRTSAYATGTEMFVIHASLAYLALSPSDQAFCVSTYAFSFLSKSPFSFFPPALFSSHSYTPWARVPRVKMQENANRLITQTQWTNIMFHSGSSSSVSKASRAVGCVFLFWWSGVPSPPLQPLDLCSCQNPNPWGKYRT